MSEVFHGLGFRPGDCVVVTGAASGIGRATAVMAARWGLVVSCWDLDEAGLDSIVAEISANGGAVQATTIDVASCVDLGRAWKSAATLGVPRYLVNNAAPASGSSLSLAEGLSRSAGSMAAITEYWLESVGNDAEAVTFTASVAGNVTTTPKGAAWYGAAKAAVAAYAREIAVHHGGRPRANVIAPGIISTPRTAELRRSAVGQRAMTRNPLGRFGEPTDCAAAICFLLSPAASYINGVTVPIDGGASWVS